ncbi:hypothetical protein ACQ9AR_06680 [Streptomyces lividans]|uniref:Resolvase/invertase-type recombinase catalytic domain-containing protein n=2 Tax=Streptomyces lividans TaxID=1916 RepID=A0ABM5QXW9_STRLI|nr:MULTISPECIES: hypothetical protein [Streptomyces]ABP49087.1 hypothetical protein SLG11 [Streptomyces lividans]AIJ12720.1 hypothetical protein SLIV_08565 [Streptomyces lividans TK24]EFD66079.1 conserved hypothetical protein [Streptomyces lividans TK24]KKD17113.1 hypothetical protein TR66_01720 [Streptomyces sp. WM6391]QSJ08234.1 hypothetical protein SLIVDG2_08565 [Streptomyces lividans]
MSPHDAVKRGPDVLSLVALDRGRGKHAGGRSSTAGNDHPRGPRTSPRVKRQSRASQLRGIRQHFYRQVVDAQADQPLRVLAYSLVPSPRARPDEDWGTLQAEADQLGYAIAARLHDVAVPVTTTYFPASSASQGVYTPPWDRPGWREAERQLRAGLADGVLVLDRHNISSDDDEYHAVIKHLGEHCRAFLHLVISEEPVAPT